MQAPASQNFTTKAYADRMDIFPLPTLWPLDAKADKLRLWSDSIPSDVTIRTGWMQAVHDLSAKIQVGLLGADVSNNCVIFDSCNVSSIYEYSAQYAIAFTEDTQPVERSALHDIGIPEPCTDILYLLIDDVLHMSEMRLDRYYRVWFSTGSAMLVASTTTRTFNAAGSLIEVSRRDPVE
jgi:hypothetical protein